MAIQNYAEKLNIFIVLCYNISYWSNLRRRVYGHDVVRGNIDTKLFNHYLRLTLIGLQNFYNQTKLLIIFENAQKLISKFIKENTLRKVDFLELPTYARVKPHWITLAPNQTLYNKSRYSKARSINKYIYICVWI